MADRESAAELEQEQGQGEAWIDSVKDALDAQTELYIGGLRLWRRLNVAAVEMGAEMLAGAARVTAGGVSGVASSATQAAASTTESISVALSEGTRRARQQAEEGAVRA